MQSKDIFKTEFKEKMVAALKANDESKFADVFTDFAEKMKSEVVEDFKLFEKKQDKEILTKRGIRQLTSEEETFYKAFAAGAKNGSIEKAFNGVENAYPETVVTSVFEDIRSEFPLLDKIDFQFGTILTKMLINKKGVQLASWSKLGEAITRELDGAFDVIDISVNKLAALVPVSMDIVEAGPQWIDSYVRAVLVESVGQALCYASVNGTGNGEPIGMMRDCSNTANVVGGVYPEKNPIIISDLGAETLGVLFSEIATDENGRARKVNGVIMVVNPIDYYSKVFPAICFMTAAGEYSTRTPLPVEFIEEPSIERGKAAFGIAGRYFLGVSYGGKTGNISFDDSYKFGEDVRVYKNKILADGRPKDSSSFVVLDISELKPAALPVDVVSNTKYKVRLNVAPKTIAQVAIADAEGVAVQGVSVSSATGEVMIPPLAAGTYEITVSGEGYTSKTETLIVSDAAVDLGTITISKA